MIDYRFLAVDAKSGLVKEEMPFEAVKFELALNGAGSFSASLPADHPKATRENLDPARTLIFVERNGTIVWSGWVWGAKANATTIAIDGAELWSYWRHRYLRTTLRFADIDTAAIAAFVIGVLQGVDGSWQSEIEWAPTGSLRTVTYFDYERQNAAEIVEGLAAASGLYGGFDFGIVSNWVDGELGSTFAIWKRRGRVLDFVFDDGGTAEDIELTVDGNKCANRVDVLGDGQQAGQKIATAETSDLRKVYPLLEAVESWDSNVQSVLSYRALGLLAALKQPIETHEVTAAKHPAVEFGTYSVGDTVQLRANRGFVTVDASHRVTSIEVNVDASGSEVVKPTFASEESIG